METWNFSLLFRISDSDLVKYLETRKSVSGNSTFLCGTPVIQRGTMQRIVALSVTEAELCVATKNAQEMVYKNIIAESLGLHVKFPMILGIDNKGGVDLMNNYSAGGRTQNLETRQYFIRQLKEEVIIKVIWAPGELNSSDMYRKNMARADSKNHAKAYVGDDKD
jgi:hypothetical protein